MKEKLKNKKVVYTIIGIISVLLVAAAVTYAYWLVTKTQQGENVISSACLDIDLVGENDITLPNQFPISDTDGSKLTPYEFTITNKCNTAVDYHVNLEALDVEDKDEINADALKAVLDTNTPKLLYEYAGTDTTIDGAYEAFILGYGTLAAASDETTDDEVSYELRIWIDEDANISEMNKSFRSKITVTVGQGITAEDQGTRSYEAYLLEKNYGLKFGDKIEYDEGAGYTSEIDTAFVMKNLEWRVLGLNDAGQIELVSTQPTDSQFTLSGASDGWLYAEQKLDQLSDDLYGNGTGAVSARSLKITDLNKFAGITTDEDKKALNTNYGKICQFQYSNTNSVIQRRISTDNGVTWPAWSNVTETAYTTAFYEPGKPVINSSNYQDIEGNQLIASITYNGYSYVVSEKITIKTRDGILMSDLLTKGLNTTNDGVDASAEHIRQWLSSTAVHCDTNNASWRVYRLKEDKVEAGKYLYFSNNQITTGTEALRPVITLNADVQFEDTDNDGILNIA